MDGVVNGKKGSLFFCRRRDGHVLGLKVRVLTEHGFEDRLLLFRHAVVAGDLSQAQVLAKLVGTTHDIECEVCGSRRTWWNDRPVLSALGALYGDPDPHPVLPHLGKGTQNGGG